MPWPGIIARAGLLFCALQIAILGTTETPTIQQYIKDSFGYEYSFIGPVVGILLGFTVFFAGLAIGALPCLHRYDMSSLCLP